MAALDKFNCDLYLFQPTMVQWIELLTKQFNSCQGACEWFLDHMAESDWWPQQILIKCPNQMVRQVSYVAELCPSLSCELLSGSL